MIKIINANLVQSGRIRPSEILINQDRIVEIGPKGAFSNATDCLVLDAGGHYVSHGFIDLHLHGGNGCDFMDATPNAYIGAAAFHASHGTTDMLPTTLAASRKELLKTFEVYDQVKDQREGARFLGLHLEGPYVSPQQAGAQDPKYIRRPDPAEYKMLADACPYIVRWTIAPEVEGALQMAEFLRGRGILPSIGHSNATYDQVKEAVKHGFTHVTHLYSGCSTITRKGGFRYPGVIESAYLIDELTVEIIADGCHLPAPLLQMVMRFIGPQRTCLITDASRGAGQPDGESILGSLENGQKVIIEDGVAKLPDRSAFAGSVATCDRLVRTMINMAHVSLPEAIDMMTARPAAIIGKEDVTGTLEKGRLADLIFFDESINILLTMVGGKIIYRKVEKNE